VSMTCYVCGCRASKIRVIYGVAYSLCKVHGLNDLWKFEWIKGCC